MNWVSELKQRMADGLYLHNLQQITECCERAMKESHAVIPAYVIRSVIADLHRDWEGRAVLVDEARRVEAVLRPALDQVVEALLHGEPPQAVVDHLERLVKAWLSV